MARQASLRASWAWIRAAGGSPSFNQNQLRWLLRPENDRRRLVESGAVFRIGRSRDMGYAIPRSSNRNWSASGASTPSDQWPDGDETTSTAARLRDGKGREQAHDAPPAGARDWTRWRRRAVRNERAHSAKNPASSP